MALWALSAVEMLAKRSFVGDTQPTVGAADPFAAILPWELTSPQGLSVPRTAGGELDDTYGAQLFEYTGVCLLPSAISPALVASCLDAAETVTRDVRTVVSSRGVDPDGIRGFRFHEACQRGPGRLNMRLLSAHAPFDDPCLHAEAAWMPLVRRLLGDECTLLFQGLVVSDPGASEQAIHSDGPHIPREQWQLHEPHAQLPASSTMPCHALTVFVPLVDLTNENGATAFLPGSHQCEIATEALECEAGEPGSTGGAGTPARLEVAAGSAIVFDYRTFHAGGRNRSVQRRPILYLVYGRPWFADDFNFPSAAEASLYEGSGQGAGGSRGSGFATALAVEDVEALRVP